MTTAAMAAGMADCVDGMLQALPDSLASPRQNLERMRIRGAGRVIPCGAERYAGTGSASFCPRRASSISRERPQGRRRPSPQSDGSAASQKQSSIGLV